MDENITNPIVQGLLKKINNTSENALVEINTKHNSKELFIFIEGIPTSRNALIEWHETFIEVVEQGHLAFYQKLDKRKSSEENAALLVENLTITQKKYPAYKIHLIGYSAGGVILLDAIVREQISLGPRLQATTIASPINGFGFNKLKVSIARPFIGKLKTNLGRKIKSIRNSEGKYQYCYHHINLDCTLDPVACPRNGIHPQIRGYSQENELFKAIYIDADMPCTLENTYTYNTETHQSIVYRVIQSLLQPKH